MSDQIILIGRGRPQHHTRYIGAMARHGDGAAPGARGWQEWRGSNPQPPVLETGALPVELHSFIGTTEFADRGRPGRMRARGPVPGYFRILATTPAPTVRPPSRIAKRKPSSIAIGTRSSTSIVMLSPGITISVPSGSVTVPVTSVVRK